MNFSRILENARTQNNRGSYSQPNQPPNIGETFPVEETRLNHDSYEGQNQKPKFSAFIDEEEEEEYKINIARPPIDKGLKNSSDKGIE